MWSRKRLDVGWADLAYGVWHCLLPSSAKIRELRSPPAFAGDMLACLSVRSGFDLLLSALNWPSGSEVLVSAVTIPDMVAVIEAHGLKPIPIDLTPNDMSPRIDVLRRAITPATRAALVAHLFGGRVDLASVADVAADHGLLLIEDCAQAYRGPGDLGDLRADVSMFSFGPIKSATALGGALLRVRDPYLLNSMHARQASYPTQSRLKYLQRIAKYAGLKLVSAPAPFGCLAMACRCLRVDIDRLVNGSVRGFARQDLLAQIRRRPCAPLLALLARRLRQFDGQRLEARVIAARMVLERSDDKMRFPGAAAADHTHWVLPLYASQPQQLMERLREAGFDSTQGQSLCVVSAPSGRPDLEPHDARETMAGTVFLPCYPEISGAERERLIHTLAEYFDHFPETVCRQTPPAAPQPGVPAKLAV